MHLNLDILKGLVLRALPTIILNDIHENIQADIEVPNPLF